jgi:RimJ/RimL family protein N-acetyltransferase
MSFRIEDMIAGGASVALEPLAAGHAAGLAAISGDPSIWAVTSDRTQTPEEVDAYIRAALADRDAGVSFAFAVRHLASGRLAGSTRYMNYAPAHRRVEIGSTWYGVEFQRTAVNTECKYLLLRHAFEVLELNRVELKTDLLNTRSQQAIERIGAKREGVLRRHMITSTGRVRDTVYFSILREEWPEVSARLRSLLMRPAEH